jgi:hypothetical protein
MEEKKQEPNVSVGENKPKSLESDEESRNETR